MAESQIVMYFAFCLLYYIVSHVRDSNGMVGGEVKTS